MSSGLTIDLCRLLNPFIGETGLVENAADALQRLIDEVKISRSRSDGNSMSAGPRRMTEKHCGCCSRTVPLSEWDHFYSSCEGCADWASLCDWESGAECDHGARLRAARAERANRAQPPNFPPLFGFVGLPPVRVWTRTPGTAQETVSSVHGD